MLNLEGIEYIKYVESMKGIKDIKGSQSHQKLLIVVNCSDTLELELPGDLMGTSWRPLGEFWEPLQRASGSLWRESGGFLGPSEASWEGLERS